MPSTLASMIVETVATRSAMSMSPTNACRSSLHTGADETFHSVNLYHKREDQFDFGV